MLVFAIFALMISALEAIYYFCLAMLFWTAPLGAAFAVAFAVASTRPADPLAPLYAFFVAALIGRFGLSCLVALLRGAANA